MNSDVYSYFTSLLSDDEQIEKEEWNKFERLLKVRRLKKGDYFVRAGEISNTVGYMKSGLIRYFYVNHEGAEYTRYFCQGNSLVTSYTALIDKRPSEYYIQALEDTELLVFPYDKWLSLTESHVVWGHISIQLQNYAIRMLEERERSLIMDDAKKRYLSFLQQYPGIESKLKQYDIASYLGITAVALSRIRADLRK